MINIVFSYDCEGNWGFVDRADSVLDDDLAGALQDAYLFLRDLHLSHDIPATFAFVALYAMQADARTDYIRRHSEALTGRSRHIRRRGGCWDGAENFGTILRATRQSGILEIGSHSLTHVPFPAMTEAEQQDELVSSKAVLQDLAGIAPGAFVFPQNRFGSLVTCRRHFRTYRNTPAASGITALSGHFGVATGLLPSRTSQFSDTIYWRGGSWRHVPDFGWKQLWRKRLLHAQTRTSDQTVHVWTHPHNLATDRSSRDRISWLFDLIEANRDVLRFYKLSEIDIDGQVFPAEAGAPAGR